MLIPILVGGALYIVWQAGKSLRKTDTTVLLGPATAQTSIKLGQTVGVVPPDGGIIISISDPQPATKASNIATAITPAIKSAVPPTAVAPTAAAAAANIVASTPTVLATVSNNITPAIASVVPPAAVPAAANAAAANIVSSVPTNQQTLAAAIAPTLIADVHPAQVDTIANQAAANINSTLASAHDALAVASAPAIAAVAPAAVVPAAASDAATTTMAGEAGSFFLHPRNFQMFTANGEGQEFLLHPRFEHNGMWNAPDKLIYPDLQRSGNHPHRAQHAYGGSWVNTWGADTDAAKAKAGSGKQAVIKPKEAGSALYTVAWKDKSGVTNSTIINVVTNG
jgi:hypothetical protein